MMKRTLAIACAMSTLIAGFAYAAIPNTSDYLHRTTPMITGTVFSVDDRQIVVDTDQEQRVTLVMDSRTMLPTDLAPGMLMRAEFRVMENGQYYVNRITPIRDADHAPSASAFWRTRGDDMELSRSNATRQSDVTDQPVAAEQPAVVTEPAATDAVADAAPVATVASTDDATTLPQTASAMPLVALLGLLALGGAGILLLKQRLARV